MVGDLITIIESLWKISEHKNSKLEKRIDKLFSPIFSDLETVHSNYLHIFEEIYSMIPYDWEPRDAEFESRISQAISTLRSKRIEYEPVRVKLQTFMNELNALKLSDLEYKFVSSVIEYFPTGCILKYKDEPATKLSFKTTISSKMLDDIYKHLDGDLKYDLKQLIRATISLHKEKWKKTCSSYSSLIASAY